MGSLSPSSNQPYSQRWHVRPSIPSEWKRKICRWNNPSLATSLTSIPPHWRNRHKTPQRHLVSFELCTVSHWKKQHKKQPMMPWNVSEHSKDYSAVHYIYFELHIKRGRRNILLTTLFSARKKRKPAFCIPSWSWLVQLQDPQVIKQ